MKRIFCLLGVLLLVLSACGQAQGTASGGASSDQAASDGASADGTEGTVELVIFAAASLTESMDEIITQYQGLAPNVVILPNYDSSGTLQSQIEAGADCDLFLSAAQKQMDALDEAGLLLPGSRVNLLGNEVVLAVPSGNPKGLTSFEQLAGLLESGEGLLAIGNSDVPVGQYTQTIFDGLGLSEEALAERGVLTYGSNVKEVTTLVSEAAVDGGIIYATDAFSAGLEAVDRAEGLSVVYPAAVLQNSAHAEEAAAFLDYLRTDPAAAGAFTGVGFAMLS